jgi:hypothetical protein
MTSDLTVPQEYQSFCDKLFQKQTITEREFVELCLLAMQLIDKHWDMRQGIAYKIVGAWMNYRNIDQDELLDAIGQECGQLEIPDIHGAGSEAAARQRWEHVKELVREADQKYPAT